MNGCDNTTNQHCYSKTIHATALFYSFVTPDAAMYLSSGDVNLPSSLATTACTCVVIAAMHAKCVSKPGHATTHGSRWRAVPFRGCAAREPPKT